MMKVYVLMAPPSVRGIYDTWAVCDAAVVLSYLGAFA